MTTLQDEYESIGAGIAGVYSVTHIETGRQYIGQSADMRARWHQHVAVLNAGNHGRVLFQEDWAAFGRAAFRFNVLATIQCATVDGADTTGQHSQRALFSMERFLISEMSPTYNGSQFLQGGSHRLGELVRAARFERDMTQSQVAVLTGYSLPSISGLENGRQFKSMNTDFALRLHEVLGIPLDELPPNRAGVRPAPRVETTVMVTTAPVTTQEWMDALCDVAIA